MMTMTQQDLDDKKCLRFKNDDLIQYQCFFELEFQIQNQTFFSYFTCATIYIHLNVANAPGIIITQMQRLGTASVKGCVDNNQSCSVNININSSLLYCKDDDCVVTSSKPFSVLILNKYFTLIHKITDPSFQNGWGI